jgi:hypothetical protein
MMARSVKRKRQAPKKVPKKHSSQACNRFS